MRLDVCSICKKAIKDFSQFLEIGFGIPQPQYVLCKDCGQPLIEFLEAHGLKAFTYREPKTT